MKISKSALDGHKKKGNKVTKKETPKKKELQKADPEKVLENKLINQITKVLDKQTEIIKTISERPEPAQSLPVNVVKMDDLRKQKQAEKVTKKKWRFEIIRNQHSRLTEEIIATEI